jgi:hypothetical protein
MGDLEYEPMTHAEKIQWMLDERGWGAVPVRPADSAAPGGAGYTHTFGLEGSFGRPEIVVCGLQPAQARGLLDLVVAQYQAGIELPADGPFVGLLDNDLPAVLLTLDPDAHAHLVPTIVSVSGESPWRLQQFVWPDPSGALPWDDGCPEAIRLAQPILT